MLRSRVQSDLDVCVLKGSSRNEKLAFQRLGADGNAVHRTAHCSRRSLHDLGVEANLWANIPAMLPNVLSRPWAARLASPGVTLHTVALRNARMHGNLATRPAPRNTLQLRRDERRRPRVAVQPGRTNQESRSAKMSRNQTGNITVESSGKFRLRNSQKIA